MARFRSMAAKVTLFSKSDIVIRQLPVNSSAPVSTTMMSPKGNSRPETTRTSATLSKLCAATLVTEAPNAMMRPLSNPNTRSRGADMAHFFTPASQ